VLDSQRLEVSIIGVGVMGECLLHAITKLTGGRASIAIADLDSDRTMKLKNRYRCQVLSSLEAARQAHNIFVVVKPQDSDWLLEEIGSVISKNQRVISFVAGKHSASIERYFNEGVPVLRVMPNTPMSVGIGASAISAGKYASNDDVKAVEELLKASGKTIVVDESLQDAVTATSGYRRATPRLW